MIDLFNCYVKNPMKKIFIIIINITYDYRKIYFKNKGGLLIKNINKK